MTYKITRRGAPSREEVEDKVALRARIAADVERFVSEKNTITQIPIGVTGEPEINGKTAVDMRIKRQKQVHQRITRSRNKQTG